MFHQNNQNSKSIRVVVESQPVSELNGRPLLQISEMSELVYCFYKMYSDNTF